MRERYFKHYLHHCIDTEDDGTEVLGGNPDLDGLDDRKGVCISV